MGYGGAGFWCAVGLICFVVDGGVALGRARRRRYAYATRAPAPSGEHLQYSILGKTSKLATLKHRRFLIPKSPCFEPGALIGWHRHSACAARFHLAEGFLADLVTIYL
jgi:hypothetical protein